MSRAAEGQDGRMPTMPPALTGTGLDGAVVIVTGGGSGIGAATARRLGAGGTPVVLVGRREDPLKEVAAQVVAGGGQALCVPADLADPASPRRIVRACLDRYGRLGFELIQPVGGPSIYQEFLDTHGEGVQHIACMKHSAQDSEALKKHRRERGAEILMGGRIGASIEFYYVDTSAPAQVRPRVGQRPRHRP
jgi:short chain dehydrogenase/Glyoxalase/Bleomycin resistance protein/Dioxygenase superfamily